MRRLLTMGLCLIASGVATAADTTSTDPTRFFPGASAFEEDWYASQLRALGETPLSITSAPAGPVIRFTWLRSFHHPVVLRLERAPDGQWQLRTKIASGAGGYDPGHLAHDRTVPIRRDRAESVLTQLTRESFWTAPSQSATFGADGAQWILEVRDGAEYHYLDRWPPVHTGSRFRCCFRI